MYEVNRSLIVVRAKQPFVQWINSLPDPGDLTLDEVNEESTAYLLPEYEDDSEMEKFLKKYYPIIFEEQLNGWWVDPEDWPANRNLKTFKDWFDFEFHCIVFDLIEEPIQKFD
jgi:hypothetical protein